MTSEAGFPDSAMERRNRPAALQSFANPQPEIQPSPLPESAMVHIQRPLPCRGMSGNPGMHGCKAPAGARTRRPLTWPSFNPYKKAAGSHKAPAGIPAPEEDIDYGLSIC